MPRRRVLIAIPLLWLLGSCVAVPAGSDHYQAPLFVKLLVTVAHVVAATVLLKLTRDWGWWASLSIALLLAYTAWSVFVLWVLN